jgi:transcriptional regulator with XRE-family HTH domain
MAIAISSLRNRFIKFNIVRSYERLAVKSHLLYAFTQVNIAVETTVWGRNNNVSLGAKLTELRLRRNVSLQTVADAVGVSKAHIWELEKGRTGNPTLSLISSLADYFAVTVSYLVGEDPAATGVDPELARMFRQAGELNEPDRALLDDMMQSLLRRANKGKSD